MKKNIIPNGVVEDPRLFQEIEKDWKHVSSGTPVKWVEKKEWKSYTPRYQNGSYSCVFQSCAKALEVLTGKVISATPYFWRKNYPYQGAYLQDGGDIFYNRFSTLETLSPSQNQSEVTMNKIKQLTTTIGITGYRQPNFKSIEEIAEAIDAYGQCIVTIGTTNQEYGMIPFYSGQTPTFYHAVCGVDFGLLNGKKVIRIEDSAGDHSVRYFTEDFIVNRGTGALYFIGSKDVTVPQDIEQQKISIATKLIALLKQAIAYFKK